MTKLLPIMISIAGMSLLPGLLVAKGCLKGAAVGAVVGHVAGHHGVAGAAAGCVIGHHHAKVKAEQAKQEVGAAQGKPPANEWTDTAPRQTAAAPHQ